MLVASCPNFIKIKTWRLASELEFIFQEKLSRDQDALSQKILIFLLDILFIWIKGCGKTSFINILAAKVPAAGSQYLKLSGEISINNKSISEKTIRKVSAYVTQVNLSLFFIFEVNLFVRLIDFLFLLFLCLFVCFNFFFSC